MMRKLFPVLVTAVALFAMPVQSGWIGAALASPQEESYGGDHDEGHDSHAGHDSDAELDGHEHPDGDSDHGHGAEGDHMTTGHGGDDGHAAHANTNPLSVDPDLAIFTAIIFALLAVILRKFAWGPIREAVEAREKRIADQLTDAQRSNEEARRLLEEHESKLAASAEEVKSLMDEARRDAETQKERIIAEAEEAASEQKVRVVREIEAAKNSCSNR